MGLFIGASILTLLEILDYIYEARKGPIGGPPHSWRGIGGGLWEKAPCGLPGGAGCWEVKLWVLCQGPLTDWKG